MRSKPSAIFMLLFHFHYALQDQVFAFLQHFFEPIIVFLFQCMSSVFTDPIYNNIKKTRDTNRSYRNAIPITNPRQNLLTATHEVKYFFYKSIKIYFGGNYRLPDEHLYFTELSAADSIGKAQPNFDPIWINDNNNS